MLTAPAASSTSSTRTPTSSTRTPTSSTRTPAASSSRTPASASSAPTASAGAPTPTSTSATPAATPAASAAASTASATAPSSSPPPHHAYTIPDDHVYGAACAMCVRHRCDLSPGAWDCAHFESRYTTSKPSPNQGLYCMCACCRIQCKLERSCPVWGPDMTVEEALAWKDQEHEVQPSTSLSARLRATKGAGAALLAVAALVALVHARRREAAASPEDPQLL
mmetsp:Transcript_8390/g.23074  ORF Transcript_8390/g.23074 Transcript_8390/m.23074 type:complete len:223 (+) Transcript_8390:2-670(+)